MLLYLLKMQGGMSGIDRSALHSFSFRRIQDFLENTE